MSFIFSWLLILFLLFIGSDNALGQMCEGTEQEDEMYLADDPAQESDLEIEVSSKWNDSAMPEVVRDSAPEGTDDQGSLNKDPEVTLFVASWCPWCRKAESFLREKGIQFVAYDIELDKRAVYRLRKLAGNGNVPFAIINGENIQGFNENIYNSALEGLVHE